MSQAGGPSASRRVVPAQMNIYTVLAVVATLALLVGIGFVWNVSSKITGQQNPWYIEPNTADQNSIQPAQ